MMMMFFNHLAALDRQPLPKVQAGAQDALWLTAEDGARVMTPALLKQHLHTQRDMESKVAEMKERGDNIAVKSRISYHRHADGRSGTIRFDF
ncbi:MAG: hypothetical protein Q8K65_10235 [Alphaproteobacteria bacterium]|nr:hypothetical protein [Alphaproteobacteria bacterium]